MTVAELIQELEYMDPNAEVRFASQPNWPFEYDIESVTSEVSTETSIDPVVYLEEGRQIGYLPEEAKDELGW
jgi:hypothetical protein